LQFKSPEGDPGKEVKSLNLDRCSSSVNDYSTPATEFSNGVYDAAMKNSNPDEIHDIELNHINISLSGAFEQKNFNILNEIRLLSYMGRVG
jgi:hypothetical protein